MDLFFFIIIKERVTRELGKEAKKEVCPEERPMKWSAAAVRASLLGWSICPSEAFNTTWLSPKVVWNTRLGMVCMEGAGEGDRVEG